MDKYSETYKILMDNIEMFHSTILRSDIVKLATQIDRANSEVNVETEVIPAKGRTLINKELLRWIYLHLREPIYDGSSSDDTIYYHCMGCNAEYALPLPSFAKLEDIKAKFYHKPDCKWKEMLALLSA